MVSKTSFKQYCKFLVKYRTDDVRYRPWMIDFAVDVSEDKTFPQHTRQRRIEYNWKANDEYKKAIEDYLDRKHACDTAKEAFQYLWDDYVKYDWLDERYEEVHPMYRKR